MPHIIYVKKVLANGLPCQKCQQVSDRLEADGILSNLNQILIADEREPQSPGMILARRHKVERAPFFVVEESDGGTQVFDVYFAFKKYISGLNSPDS